MKGSLAILLVLGTIDFQMQPAAADEQDAIAGIVTNMAKPVALNAVRTSKALDGGVPLEDADGDCATEQSACMADTNGCLACFIAIDESCNDNPTDCSGLNDAYCCAYGEECSKNAALISYIGCVASETGCEFGEDFCSGARGIFSRHPADAFGSAVAVGIVGILVSGLGIMAV